jgi:hypothetical protein
VLFAWQVASASAANSSTEPALTEVSPNAEEPDEPPSVQIEWDAPAECPNVDEIEAHAERLLGQPLAARRAQLVVAHAVVRRNKAGNWELRLSLTANGRYAEDTLIAQQCRALGDATAMKVALAIDPVATARALETAAAAAEPKKPPPAAKPAPKLDLGAPSRSTRTSFGLRLSTGAAVGLLPSLAGGGAFALWLQRSSWRAELGGQGYWGGDARYERMPAVGAKLQLFSAVARGCPVAHWGGLDFPVCIGVELGAMRGVGFGVKKTETAYSASGAVVLGPALRAPIGKSLGFWLEAEGAYAFLRPALEVRNLGTLYSARSTSGRIWAGIEIRLGQ